MKSKIYEKLKSVICKPWIKKCFIILLDISLCVAGFGMFMDGFYDPIYGPYIKEVSNRGFFTDSEVAFGFALLSLGFMFQGFLNLMISFFDFIFTKLFKKSYENGESYEKQDL